MYAQKPIPMPFGRQPQTKKAAPCSKASFPKNNTSSNYRPLAALLFLEMLTK